MTKQAIQRNAKIERIEGLTIAASQLANIDECSHRLGLIIRNKIASLTGSSCNIEIEQIENDLIKIANNIFNLNEALNSLS